MRTITFNRFDVENYQTKSFEIDSVIDIISVAGVDDITVNVIVSQYPNKEQIYNARNDGFIVDTLVCDCVKIVTIRNLIKTQVNFNI